MLCDETLLWLASTSKMYKSLGICNALMFVLLHNSPVSVMKVIRSCDDNSINNDNIGYNLKYFVQNVPDE